MNTKNIKLGSTNIKQLYLGSVPLWPPMGEVSVLDSAMVYVPFDGALNNLGTYGVGIESYGALSPSTETRKPGRGSISFDGGGVFTASGTAFTNFPVNSDAVSISMFLKATEANNSGVVMLLEQGIDVVEDKTFALVFGYSGPGVFSVINQAESTLLMHHSNHGILTGEWVHLCVVIDRSWHATDEVKVWVNNVRLTGSLEMWPYAQAGNSGNFPTWGLNIGSRDGWQLQYRGLMQDLRFYNRALTEAEVTELYNE